MKEDLNILELKPKYNSLDFVNTLRIDYENLQGVFSAMVMMKTKERNGMNLDHESAWGGGGGVFSNI